jgi:hypothetical protein
LAKGKHLTGFFMGEVSRSARLMVLLLIAVLLALLVSCNGQPAPTETPQPTSDPAIQSDSDSTAEFTPGPPALAIGTLAAENSIIINPPAPGTLIVESEDDESGPRQPFSFRLIMLQRYGGVNNETFVVRLYPDGRVDRNGESLQISAEEVERIRVMFDEIDFYRANGIFTGPEAGPETIFYTLGVDGDQGTVSMTAQEGLIPPELQALIDVMLNLGQ